MSRYIEHCGKGERMRETTVRHISKEQYDHFKDDKRFIEFITDELTREISERIIQVLEASDEIIVKKPVLRVSEYRPTCSVEYSKTVEWEPLVRCKECKHSVKHQLGYGCGMNYHLATNGNWFCADGERSDDDRNG